MSRLQELLEQLAQYIELENRCDPDGNDYQYGMTDDLVTAISFETPKNISEALAVLTIGAGYLGAAIDSARPINEFQERSERTMIRRSDRLLDAGMSWLEKEGGKSLLDMGLGGYVRPKQTPDLTQGKDSPDVTVVSDTAQADIGKVHDDSRLAELGRQFDAAAIQLHEVTCRHNDIVSPSDALEREFNEACKLRTGLVEEICKLPARSLPGLLIKWRAALEFSQLNPSEDSKYTNELTEANLLRDFGRIFAPEEFDAWQSRKA